MDQLLVAAAAKVPVEVGIVHVDNTEDAGVVVLHRNLKSVPGLPAPSEVASSDRLPEEVAVGAVVLDVDHDPGLGPGPDPTDAVAVAIHIAGDRACLPSDVATMKETIRDAVAAVEGEDQEALRRTILAAVAIAHDHGRDRYRGRVDHAHALCHVLRPG